MDVSDMQKGPIVSKSKLRKFGYKSALTVSDNYIAKKFGPQMPLMVAEYLSKSPSAKENSSVKFNDTCGWSWLVYGRKLFVWPLSENNGYPDENATIVGKDLMLPPSDLAYNADLAVVFKDEINQFPSCISVSPEGVVRYWHSLRLHRNWVDVNSHLGGEEVCCVLYIPPFGCLALTTSASMILIEPKEIDSVHTVIVKLLTDKHSWLGGFGKKMSALLGYVPAPQFMESSAIKCVTKQTSSTLWTILLLAEHTLQTWQIGYDKYEMLCESNLKQIMKTVFQERDEPFSWEIYDMKDYEGDNFMILAGCQNPKMIVIVKFLIEDVTQPPQLIKPYRLSQVDFDVLHSSSVPVYLKFLPMPKHSFIFTNKIIISVPMGEGYEGISESIQFHNSCFLGGSFYAGVPVFFSTSHSFVSVTPISPLEYVDSASNNSFVAEPDHFKDVEIPSEGFENSYENVVTNAFFQYAKKNLTQAKTLIKLSFSNKDSVDNSPLATSIVSVSQRIINQISSKDPRWINEKTSAALGKLSLHLEKQMEEKEQSHASFVLFVQEVITPEKLGSVSYNEHLEKTMDVLADHHERIIAARALYKLRTAFPLIIDQAIQNVSERCSFPSNINIKKEEYFFTRAEFIYEGLKSLCLLPEKMNQGGTDYETYLISMLKINSILIDVITTLVRTSEKKQFLNSERKFIKSLSAPSPIGLFDFLLQQANRTRIIGKDYGSTLENGQEYLNHLFSLTDIILFTQTDFIPSEQFHELRANLIEPFIETKLYEQTLMLSEKFSYFPAMIKVCLLTNEVERLNSYINKFGDVGFCEDLFKFYTDGRMKTHLINLKLPDKYEQKLSDFLEDYPNISWAYCVKNRDYNKCYSTLHKLGMRTNDYALRKTRLLSLAKLAREVCDEKPTESETAALDLKLHILDVQNELPQSLLNNIGYGRKPVRTFSSVELIQLFIAKQNEEINEGSFKQALDLLFTIPDLDKRKELWEKIWQTAVLFDGIDISNEFPEETVNNMLFFKLINLIIMKEEDPQSFIPSYGVLLNFKSLKGILTEATEFKYILRYGYETFCESVGVHASE